MNIVFVADTFPPMRTSGAVQLRDLLEELSHQGHHVTIILPSHELAKGWQLDRDRGIDILRLRAPRVKDVGYVRRTLAEFIMPFAMLRQYRKCPVSKQRFDGIVWYSPSIFHGPLVRALKADSGCKSYLIVRDIFPEWAVDMGLMSRGLPYFFFGAIARFQYSVADVIGIQSPGNGKYFFKWLRKSGRRLEVLPNWLGARRIKMCTIRVSDTLLRNRKIFVYAGNMGVAQGLRIILDLAYVMRLRRDIGFLFVGRGSEMERLCSIAEERKLDNLVFYNEIDPDEIPDLYAQCSVGIVALDSRHKTHNIPGKFLTYLQSGLPVLACVNNGNDLVDLIRTENIGAVSEANDVMELVSLAEALLVKLDEDPGLRSRCMKVFEREFSVTSAASKVLASLATRS